MKRKELIQKLIENGFSEKTLVVFNDKQLATLGSKILKEQTTVTDTKTVYDSKDPKQVAALNQALKDPTQLKGALEVKEDESEEKDETISKSKLNAEIKKGGKAAKKAKMDLSKQKKEVNEWVDSLVEKNYHPLTTKGDIIGTITKKVNESATVIPMPNKAKIGHNGIPEFMTYDAIVGAEPATKPQEKPSEPTTVPRERPRETPRKDPRREPFRKPDTNPRVNPNPKAEKLKQAAQ